MPPAQADSSVPPAGGHGEATQEMHDARATGPRNEIDISTRRKTGVAVNRISYHQKVDGRRDRHTSHRLSVLFCVAALVACRAGDWCCMLNRTNAAAQN